MSVCCLNFAPVIVHRSSVQDASDARTQFVNLRREVEAEKSAASAKILHLETAVKQLQTQNDAHVAHAKQLASSSGLSGQHCDAECLHQLDCVMLL